METDKKRPRLRPVEINPVEDNGEKYFVVQDQQRLSDETLVLAPTGAWLLQYFNGENTLDDIKSNYREETGEEVPSDVLKQLINTLDENYLLENDRSRTRMNNLTEDFINKSIREPTLPGQSIPGTSQELDDFFEQTLDDTPSVETSSETSGLAVPHIDYQRGKETYSELIPHFENMDNYDRIVMLGISHYACPVPFSLTNKTFKTPYGSVETDGKAIKKIEKSLPYELSDGEIAHRLEHSIEIPLTLLKYAQPEMDFDIVPMICSFRSVQDLDGTFEEVTESLEEIVTDPDTFLIAGVDFAHMGPQFGDPEPLSEDDYESIEKHDLEMIDHLSQADSRAFEKHIQTDQNRRRVCGYPALRTILPIIDNAELINYEQWQDPQETVTFGALELSR